MPSRNQFSAPYLDFCVICFLSKFPKANLHPPDMLIKVMWHVLTSLDITGSVPSTRAAPSRVSKPCNNISGSDIPLSTMYDSRAFKSPPQPTPTSPLHPVGREKTQDDGLWGARQRDQAGPGGARRLGGEPTGCRKETGVGVGFQTLCYHT
jgi:hypothetical protein